MHRGALDGGNSPMWFPTRSEGKTIPEQPSDGANVLLMLLSAGLHYFSVTRTDRSDTSGAGQTSPRAEFLSAEALQQPTLRSRCCCSLRNENLIGQAHPSSWGEPKDSRGWKIAAQYHEQCPGQRAVPAFGLNRRESRDMWCENSALAAASDSNIH